jgi:hypothetical protein
LEKVITSAGGEVVTEKTKVNATLWIVDEAKDKKVIIDHKNVKGSSGVVIPMCGVEVIFDAILQ